MAQNTFNPYANVYNRASYARKTAEQLRYERLAREQYRRELAKQEADAAREAEQQRQNASWLQRIGATVGDVGGNLVGGVVKFGEGLVDAAMTGVGAVGGLFSQDFQNTIKDAVAYDFTGENILNPLTKATQNSYLYDWGKTGETIRGVAQGVGQNLPAIALNAIPGVGQALSAAAFMGSAAGNYTEEAFREGASYGSGMGYGLLGGLVEGGTEALTGGIGGTKMGKIFGKQLGKTALGKLGLTVLGEGGEEVLADVANPLLRGLTGVNSWQEVAEQYKELPQQLPETFAVGGLTGALLGGGTRVLQAKQAGGFNNLRAAENLQALRETWAEQNMAALDEKTNARDAARQTKDIEYYTQRVEQALQKMPSDKARQQFLQANGLVGAFDATGKRLLKTEQNTVAEGNRAAYSPALAGQQAVLGKYALAKTVNENVRRVTENLTRLSNGKVNYVVAESLGNTDGGQQIKGIYDRESGTIYLSQTATADDIQGITASHELLHTLEGTKEYENLQKAVFAELSRDSALAAKYDLQQYLQLYKDVNTQYSEEAKLYEAQTELIADFMANEVLANEETVRRLSVSNRNLVQRILEWVKQKLQRLRTHGGDRETLRFYQKAETLLGKALEASTGGISLKAIEAAVSEHNFENEKATTATDFATEAARYDLKERWQELGRYSEKEIASIEANKVQKVAHSYEDIQEFIAKAKPEIVHRLLYIGKITESTAKQIQQELGLDVSGKSIVLSANDIRHIFNNHGNVNTERARGQIAVTKENIENIIETIIAPDRVIRNDSNGQVGIIFKKMISGKISAVTILSEKKKALTLKSAWITKEKQSISPTADAETPSSTSKTKGSMNSVPTTNIAQNEEKSTVSKKKDEDTRYSLEKDMDIVDIKPTKFDIKKEDAASGNTPTDSATSSDERVAQKTTSVNSIRKNNERSDENGRYSLSDTVEDDVLKYFGKTYRWAETGYIFKDGTKLDLSGRIEGAPGGYRSVDHRDIFTIYDNSDINGNEALIEFMCRGNIRVNPETPGINLQVEPTEAQYKQIANLVETLGWKNKEFSVDFDNAHGDTVDTLYYEGNVSARKVADDIRYYFRNGKLPQKSELSTFRYSLSKSFAEQVDDVLAGADTNSTHLRLCNTPVILQEAGLPALPILMTARHVRTITQSEGKKKANYHGLDVEIVKRLPEQLAAPVMIMESLTRDDSIVVLTENIDTEGNPVISAILVNGKGRINNDVIEANILTSAYGKNNIISLIERSADANKIIYWNKKKSQALAVNLGLQLPDVLSNLDSNSIIRKTEAKVNSSNKKTSDTRYSLDKTKPSTHLPAEKGTAILKEIPQNEQTAKEKAQELWTNFQVHFSDEQAGIVKAGKKLGVQDIEAKTNYARAAYNAAGSMLDEYQRDRVGNRVGDGFKAIWDPIYAKGEQYRMDFYEYLLHHQNIDRLKQGKAVFANTSAADSRAAIAQLEQLHPEFAANAEKVWTYSDNLLQLRVDMGLLSQEQADHMRAMYPHYVPTARNTDGVQGIGSLRGKYNLAVKTTIKTAKGSTLDILPPDVILARQTMEVMRAGRVNEVIGALYDAAIRTGDSTDIAVLRREKLWEPQQTKTKRLTSKSAAELYAALNKEYGTKEGKNNEVTFYRDGERITLAVSPAVYIGLDAYAPNTEYRNKLIEAVAKGNNLFKKLVTSANPFFLVRNFLRDLQEAVFYTKHGPTRLISAMGKAYKQIATNGELWQKYKAAGGLSCGLFDYDTGIKRSSDLKAKAEAVIGKLEFANMFIEQGPRLAEFMLTLGKGGTVEQALLDSAEVTTNFSRGGKTAKFLNRTVMPFLNPSIQGWSKLLRTVFGKKNAQEWMMLIVKALVYGIGITALNDFLLGDDEDYAALSMRDKENYYLLKIGDAFLKLPKGRVLAVFGSLYLRGKEAARGNTNAWDGYLQSALSQVSPVDNMTRTIFSPFTDAATNTTWYGGAIEGRKFDNVAPKDRYDESTSGIAIALGQALNYSPKKIHYIIDQYSGIIGDVILPLTTKRAERNPVAANFTIDPVLSNRWSNDFYMALDEANYAKSSGDLQAAFKVRYLNAVAGEVSDMYATKQSIEASDKPSKEKAAESKAIQLLINQTQKQAISVLRQFSSKLDAADVVGTVQKLTKSEAYMQLDADAQNKAVNRLNDYLYAKALTETTGTSMPAKYYLYELLGADVAALHLAAIGSISSDADKTSNSRKEKVYEYIEKQRLTARQKYILFLLAGYKPNESGKEIVRQAINQLDADKHSKAELLELVS